MGRITFDGTRSSCLAVCTCGFRAAALTRAAAHVLARAHEVAAHPGEEQIANIQAKARERLRL